MLLTSVLAFAFAGTAVASSVVVGRETLSINPSVSVVQHHQAPSLDSRQMTNAERMVVGLPPLPPRRRGSRTSNAARAAPSSGLSIRAHVQARLAGTDTILGYAMKEYNVFGETMISAEISQAMTVILPADTDVPFNMEVVNPTIADFPFWGLIKGFGASSANLATGSANYLFLGGVKETELYSPPTDLGNSFTKLTGIDEPVESSVWTYDAATGRLAAQWINTDRSIPPLFFGYYNPDEAMIAAGDKAKFEESFGASTVQWLDLYYVQEATTGILRVVDFFPLPN